jgi:AcrR family transcriptional regulator
VPRVSEAHKDAVRRRIMDAALVCLRRNDYRNVTTREVLAEASLSTGTFYNYFPTKEHLYEALAAELLAGERARLAAGADQGDDVGAALVRFLADHVLGDPEAAVAVSMFRGRPDASGDAAAAIARLNRSVLDEFAPVVRRAQADGFLRSDLDAEALVELLDLVWDGLGRRQATGSLQTSYERVGRTVLEVVLRGAVATGDDRDPA